VFGTNFVSSLHARKTAKTTLIQLALSESDIVGRKKLGEQMFYGEKIAHK